MKINKKIGQLSREMLRASFTDGQIDRGKITSLVQSLIAKKPRRYLDILQYYKRLVRLEIAKRHARIESSTQISPETSARIVENLKKTRGRDLTTEFVINPELLGGVRIRMGSDVWDGSVRDRLERLQKQL